MTLSLDVDSVQNTRRTHVLHSKIADSTSFDLSIVYGIFDGAPTIPPLGFAPIWAVQEIQINVFKTTLLDTFLNCLSRCIIPAIRLQLGRKPQVLSSDRFLAFDEAINRRADFLFVCIPLCRVKGKISRFSSIGNC